MVSHIDYEGIVMRTDYPDEPKLGDLVVDDNKTLLWNGEKYGTITCTSSINAPDWTLSAVSTSEPQPKHFNCKFCGAPNQIDVCEYCGCAYEDS